MKDKKPFITVPLDLKDVKTLSDTLYKCYYDTDIDLEIYLIALIETAKSIAYEEEIDFDALLKCYLKSE